MTEQQIPKAAIYKKKKVRVLYYHGNGQFMVIDHRDDKRLLHRDQMTFVRK